MELCGFARVVPQSVQRSAYEASCEVKRFLELLGRQPIRLLREVVIERRVGVEDRRIVRQDGEVRSHELVTDDAAWIVGTALGAVIRIVGRDAVSGSRCPLLCCRWPHSEEQHNWCKATHHHLHRRRAASLVGLLGKRQLEQRFTGCVAVLRFLAVCGWRLLDAAGATGLTHAQSPRRSQGYALNARASNLTTAKGDVKSVATEDGVACMTCCASLVLHSDVVVCLECAKSSTVGFLGKHNYKFEDNKC